VYVDDLNIIGTTQEIHEASNHLKTEFEMKDLGKTKFCFGLQLEHISSGIYWFISVLISKRYWRNLIWIKHTRPRHLWLLGLLKRDKDPFRPKDDDEEILGPEFPYLSATEALMYLAKCTRPDISFAVNLLARYSASPTKRHWVGVKNIL
jgi:hypothetical protein